MAVPNSASITSERALASLWQRAHALAEPVCLRTQDGRRLRVIYPGTASGRAGPDFRNAVIASDDGRIIRGDVELHLRAPDWYSHGHDVDPNYNGVVLHVVLQSKGETRSEQQSGLQTPVAEIAPLMELTEELPPPVLPSAEHVGEALDRAGDERFRLRSQGYAEEIRERDPAQTLYEAIMEALGYASNRPPFKRLASRVPISLLTELRDEPETSRRLALEAMLIRASGLMSLVEPEERARELRALSKHLPRVRPIPANKWRLFRIRPANHPVRRIAGVAHLLSRHMDRGLVPGLEDSILYGSPGSLIDSLTAPGCIGRARAADMAVNVVLPFLHANAGVRGSDRLRERCLDIYHRSPALQDNEVTREMKRLLAIPKRGISGARRQQGLMHLYRSMTLGTSA